MSLSNSQIRRILEQRYSVLKQLAHAPAPKPELVDILDISRSTIDRSIDDLVKSRCIRKENSRYKITVAGRLALEKHEEYQQATDAIESTAEFLNHLPDDVPISTDLLEGASVTMGAQHAPDQALAPSIDLFERATRMRGLAPVVLSFYPTLIAEQLSNGGITVEIIAESEVIEALPNLPEVGEKSLSDVDGLSMYESDRELPYALWLMDTPESTHAGITVYDAGGVAGILVNDSEPAVRWAESQYEQYLEDGTQVSISNK